MEVRRTAIARHRRAVAGGWGRSGGTISGRLTRILALPVLAVLVLLGVVAVGDIGQYRTAKETSEAVDIALSTQELVQSLQDERGLVSGVLAGSQALKADLPPARSKVDAQRVSLAQRATAHVTGADGLRAALAKLSGLDGIRTQADSNKISKAAAFGYLTERIIELNSVDFGLDRSADSTLRRGYLTWTQVGLAKEYSAQEQAFLTGVFSAGAFQPGEYEQYAVMRAYLIVSQSQAVYITTQERQLAGQVQNSPASKRAQEIDAVAAGGADGRPLHVDPQDWWSAMGGVTGDILKLQRTIGADIQQRARKLKENAARRLAVLLGVVAACLAGAVFLMIVAAQSITRPLSTLVAEADALASRRLPDAVARVQSAAEDEQPRPPPPVRVPSRASQEIQLVAEALDRVQATAYALATEQAMMRRTTTESLANLGRRNQNLLRRQIGFITKLEQEETDPSGLANLFELDHLATRMRRNAESLLVLAGEASPRPWSEPLSMADVIRAAVSEVEDYRRVSLRRIDDAHVAGAYVTGLAHMVAELVENGLAFSPPDVDVEVQGRQMGNQYLIAVTDQGVGMKPEDLARANARLRGEEHFLTAPTRYLGHYVVGHLARQMSVEVQLIPSPVTGITARVALSASVLVMARTIEGVAEAPMPRPVATARFAHPAPRAITGPTGEIEVPAASPRPIPMPRAPEQVGRNGGVGGRRAPVVVEYVTVPDANRSDAVHTPPDDVFDAPAQADTVPSPASAATTTATGATERTRNGLTKRPPRNRPAQPPTGSAPAQRPAAMDDSPEQLRSRLLSLRAGVLRGRAQAGTEEAP